MASRTLQVRVTQGSDIGLRHKGKRTSLYVGVALGDKYQKTKSHTTSDGNVSWGDLLEFIVPADPSNSQIHVTVAERHRTSDDVTLGRSSVTFSDIEPGIPSAVPVAIPAGGVVHLVLTMIVPGQPVQSSESFSRTHKIAHAIGDGVHDIADRIRARRGSKDSDELEKSGASAASAEPTSAPIPPSTTAPVDLPPPAPVPAPQPPVVQELPPPAPVVHQPELPPQVSEITPLRAPTPPPPVQQRALTPPPVQQQPLAPTPPPVTSPVAPATPTTSASHTVDQMLERAKVVTERPTGEVIFSGLRAVGLLAADKKTFGKDSSDPFVKITCSSQTVQTKHIDSNLNPTWKEVFRLQGCRPDDIATFQVYDHDTVGTNDPLGECMLQLPWACITDAPIELPLNNIPGQKTKAQGKLYVNLSTNFPLASAAPPAPMEAPKPAPEPVYTPPPPAPAPVAPPVPPPQPPVQQPPRVPTPPPREPTPPPRQPTPPPPAPQAPPTPPPAAPVAAPVVEVPPIAVPPRSAPAAGGEASPRSPSASSPRANNKFTVLRLEATNLLAADKRMMASDTSDPFVVVMVPGQGQKKTKVKENTLNAVWEDVIGPFERVNPGQVVRFEVWDHDDIGKNDSLGECMVQIPDKSVEETVHLPLRGGENGKAKGHLSVRYRYEVGGTEVNVVAPTPAPQPASAPKPAAPTPAPAPVPVAAAAASHPAPAAQPAAPTSSAPPTSAPPAAAPAGAGKKKEDRGSPIGSLTVTKLRANGLRASDKRLFKKPSSDPFAKIFLLSDTNVILASHTTEVQKGTLTPMWHDMARLTVTDKAAKLRIEIFDWDKVGANEPLGAYELPIPKASGEENVIKELGPLGGKPGKGELAFSYHYEKFAPQATAAGGTTAVGLSGALTGITLSGAAFGRLQLKNISANGLAAADGGVLKMFGQGNSDPFVKITLVTEAGTQAAQTRVIENTLNPKWDEEIGLDIYERGSELLVQVFDDDVGNGDDCLGEYRFELPDISTEETIEARLISAPNSGVTAKGSIHFTYVVYYDEQLEWRTAFLPAPPRRRKEQRHKPPSFDLTVTRESIAYLSTAFNPVIEAVAFAVSILRWENPAFSAGAFIGFTIVCFWALFLQALIALPLAVLTMQYLKQRGAGVGSRSPVKKSAATAAAAPSEDAQSFGLGHITALTFSAAYWTEWVSDLVTWRYPSRSQPIAIALAGALVGSLIVPIRYLVWIAGVYIFTLEAVYARYPLFRQRFPPGRLARYLVNKACLKAGIKPRIPPAFHARLTVRVVEANKLRNADAGLVSFAGKSDPYVRVTIGDQQNRTRTIDDNLDPKWDETLPPFTLRKHGAVMRVQVFDADDGPFNDDEFLGETVIAIGGTGTKDIWEDLKPRRGGMASGEYVTGTIHLQYTIEEIKAKPVEALPIEAKKKQ